MRLDWYNRPRRFDNGVTWVRLLPFGLGLWWSTKGNRDTCATACVFVGRFGVGVLPPRDA
jgi:hypothetical protein